MRPVVPMVVLALLALTPVAFTACGKSTQEQRSEGIQKSADEPQKGAEGTARGLVDPVSLKELISLLPAPAGWQRERPTGERSTVPVHFADAMVRLMKGDATVTAKITDSALNQVLMEPLTTLVASHHERGTSREYEKAVTVGAAPGFEKWDSKTKSGNLSVLVNKRFIVEIDGSGIDDPKVLHEILDKIDLEKLADLK
jgi:hypothetical protein